MVVLRVFGLGFSGFKGSSGLVFRGLGFRGLGVRVLGFLGGFGLALPPVRLHQSTLWAHSPRASPLCTTLSPT